MSGKPQEIGYLFDATDLEECTGQDCKAMIYFGRKFGKRHPFNPDGSSHFDNCPNADQFRSNPKPKRGKTAKKQNGTSKSLHPKVANALAIAGDIDTEQRERWRLKQLWALSSRTGCTRDFTRICTATSPATEANTF